MFYDVKRVAMAEFSKLKYAFLIAMQVLLLAFAALCTHWGATFIAVLAIFGALVFIRSARRLRFPILRRSKPPFPIKSREWLVGAGLFVVLVAATTWLFHDAQVGYKSGSAPIVVFLAAMLVCGVWWGRIFMRWFMWWF